MNLPLVLLSLLITGLRAAPKGIKPKVINGVNEYVQHATAVFAITSLDGGGTFGGGSIISNRHVLTAANVVIGAISCNVGYGSKTLSPISSVTTTNIALHPQFNRTTLENDIAIIILTFANPIVLSDLARPISLPTVEPGAGLEGRLAGFGKTYSDAKEISQLLLIANLVFEPLSTCTEHFQLELTTHFCAVGRPGVVPGLITNSCPGDNGAAFYTGDNVITTTPEPEESTGSDENGESVENGDESVENGESDENGESEEVPLPQGVLDATTYERKRSPIPLNRRKLSKKSRKTANEQISPVEQVEPVVIGIASAMGPFWVCNPEDPRAYTNVLPYVNWIRETANIPP